MRGTSFWGVLSSFLVDLDETTCQHGTRKMKKTSKFEQPEIAIAGAQAAKNPWN